MAQQYFQENSRPSRPPSGALGTSEPLAVREFDALPSILSAPCAMATSVIDRNCFINLLSDARCSVAFGQPCSPTLRHGIQEAIEKLSTSFYTMIDVTLDDLHDKLSEWFRGQPLGELDRCLELELQADIESDVIGFINAIQDSPVTLRLVLDLSSGFESLRDIFSSPPSGAISNRIEEIASELEYDRAYLFHTDEDVVNQLKSYCGATTLGIDPCDIAAQPSFDPWFSLFSDKGSLRELASDAIVRRDAEALEAAIRLTMEKAWRYQTELPGLAKPGSSPYRFLLGAPHLYFGAPDKLAPYSHAHPKSALHAKPLIWTTQPQSRRFLTLLDSPRDFSL